MSNDSKPFQVVDTGTPKSKDPYRYKVVGPEGEVTGYLSRNKAGRQWLADKLNYAHELGCRQVGAEVVQLITMLRECGDLPTASALPNRTKTVMGDAVWLADRLLARYGSGLPSGIAASVAPYPTYEEAVADSVAELNSRGLAWPFYAPSFEEVLPLDPGVVTSLEVPHPDVVASLNRNSSTCALLLKFILGWHEHKAMPYRGLLNKERLAEILDAYLRATGVHGRSSRDPVADGRALLRWAWALRRHLDPAIQHACLLWGVVPGALSSPTRKKNAVMARAAIVNILVKHYGWGIRVTGTLINRDRTNVYHQLEIHDREQMRNDVESDVYMRLYRDACSSLLAVKPRIEHDAGGSTLPPRLSVSRGIITEA